MTDQTLGGVAGRSGPVAAHSRPAAPSFVHIRPSDRRIYRCSLCDARVSGKFAGADKRGRLVHVGAAKKGGECSGLLKSLADEEMSESTRRLMRLAREGQTRLAAAEA